MSKDQEVLS